MTISLNIDDKRYEALKAYAEVENRSISNFVETAAMKYIEEIEFADDLEMEAIESDRELIEGIRQGIDDAKARRGRFV